MARTSDVPSLLSFSILKRFSVFRDHSYELCRSLCIAMVSGVTVIRYTPFKESLCVWAFSTIATVNLSEM